MLNKYLKFFLIFSIILNIVFGAIGLNFYFHPKTIIETKTVEVPVVKKYPLSGGSILTLINIYRAENKIAPVTYSNGWCDQAKIRVEEVAINMNHDGFWNIQSRKSANWLGENVTAVNQSELAVINAWKTSPTHNTFLLDSRVRYGCVATNGNETVFLGSDTF